MTSAEDWDLFVSYASDDKEPFVAELVYALRTLGLSVWFDDFEVRIGDSIREKITRSTGGEVATRVYRRN